MIMITSYVTTMKMKIRCNDKWRCTRINVYVFYLVEELRGEVEKSFLIGPNAINLD